ncbi:MAG: HprK-related kinase B [Planctomycetes bacterium]|nr:HprK-related kinase B [Planctomycetota bacterium]
MQSAKEVLSEVLERYRPEFALSFALGGFSVSIETNSRKLARELKDYFSECSLDVRMDRDDSATNRFLVFQDPTFGIDLEFTLNPPSPGKSGSKEEFHDFEDGVVIRKVKTGLVTILTDSEWLIAGDVESNPNQVINAINNKYIESRMKSGYSLFHASAIARKGRGIAISGFSGAGKSTLALHLAGRKFDFITNDRALIKRRADGLGLLGIPKLPRINPGTIVSIPSLAKMISEEDRKRFLSLPPEELWTLEYKYDAFITRNFDSKVVLSEVPLEAYVILNWKRTSEQPIKVAKVDLAERLDLMISFTKPAGLFIEPGNRGRFNTIDDDEYIALLKGANVYEISGGVDFKAAADFCEELV